MSLSLMLICCAMPWVMADSISARVMPCIACCTEAFSCSSVGMLIICTYACALPLSSRSLIYSRKAACLSASVSSLELSLNGSPVKISVLGESFCAVMASDSLLCSMTYLVRSLVYAIEPESMGAEVSSFGRMMPVTFSFSPLS